MKKPNNIIISTKCNGRRREPLAAQSIRWIAGEPPNMSTPAPIRARLCKILHVCVRICKHFQASAKFWKLVQCCSTGAMRAAQYIKTSTKIRAGASKVGQWFVSLCDIIEQGCSLNIEHCSRLSHSMHQHKHQYNPVEPYANLCKALLFDKILKQSKAVQSNS